MRLATLSTGFLINHLDHLGPLSATLNVPLITDERRSAELLDRLYPDVNVLYLPHARFTIEYLAENFDGLIISTRHYKNEMTPLFMIHGKEMVFIHSPHGNSDKEAITAYDGHTHAIIYGQHMRDLLKKRGIVVPTIYELGNYRLKYYKKHQSFFDSLVKSEIFFPVQQRTLLYAPTWQDVEDSSSLDSYGARLLKTVPKTINLIVKLHPLSLEMQPSLTHYLLEKYSNKPNIHFLIDFPPVYPLFSLVDGYIGDFSSVGYDFLYTGKPMFFISHDDREVLLHKCGLVLPKENIFPFIESSFQECGEPFKEIREEVFRYAFHTTHLPQQVCRDFQL